MKSCRLCPRDCRVDREQLAGYCRAEKEATVAKIMLHKWEEPCICYGSGSGAIFFSACQLRCLYCQNHAISRHAVGQKLDSEALCRTFFELQEQGACNINLVSPTPHLETILPAMQQAKAKGLSIPFVFNSGGYEKKETLERLRGLIDVYLLDFKYFSSELSKKYSDAANYKESCIEALEEALNQCPNPHFSGEKLMQGVIVRHLVLPGATEDSKNVLFELKRLGIKDRIVLSLMRQYTPTEHTKNLPPLHRRLTSLEYSKITALAEKLDFPYRYTQRKESASEDYIPDFQGNN